MLPKYNLYIRSMKLRVTIPIAIGLALVLAAVINTGAITHHAAAAGTLGGTSGVTTAAGSNAGGVDPDPNLFCNTGVKTPICK
jgi:hypothetical protein